MKTCVMCGERHATVCTVCTIVRGGVSEREAWIRALKVVGFLPSCFDDDGNSTPTQVLGKIMNTIRKVNVNPLGVDFTELEADETKN